MTKVPKDQVIQEQLDNDIWTDDEMSWWSNEYQEDYWDGVHSGEMSWQWYMRAKELRSIGWQEVVISPDHKVETVMNWLKENYLFCQVRTEHQHMLIEDKQAATMVALKFS